MTFSTPATPNHTREIQEILGGYAAPGDAGFLLPQLRRGMRVLDLGSGSGGAAEALAAAIAPGTLHDVGAAEAARAGASRSGQGNATFSAGDAGALEFEDGFFDAAYCHDVLVHAPDTLGTLAEVRRVLRPGGVIGCREIICRSSFTYPELGVLDRAWDIFEDVLTAEDCHPHVGRALKSRVVEAGFTGVQAGASFSVFSAPEDIEAIFGLARRWLPSSGIAEAAIRHGAATRRLCEEIVEAYEEWRRHPGALVAVAFGEVVAYKPAQPRL